MQPTAIQPAAPVWLWRMRHPDLPVEWGMRIERPLMDPDAFIYVSITLNGQVHRGNDGLLLVSRAARLEPLLKYGDLWRKVLRADGFEDVEEEA